MVSLAIVMQSFAPNALNIRKNTLDYRANDNWRLEVIEDIICNVTGTGSECDGMIFTLPVEDAIRMRTDERGDSLLVRNKDDKQFNSNSQKDRTCYHI